MPTHNCQHLNTRSILTPDGPHYAKTICVDCGAFVRWEPKPQTLERNLRNAELMAALKSKSTSEWEKGFLLSLEKAGTHLSPKQQAKLEEIAKRHGVL